MKKIFIIFELIVLSFLFVSCKPDVVETVNLKIYVEGKFRYETTVEKGRKVDFNYNNSDYYFINWTDETGEIDYTGYTINEDMDLYANAIKYGTLFTITYHLDDEAYFVGNSHPRGYYFGEGTSLVDPKRPTKYEFTGWYCNGKLITEIPADMYGDIDLYDSWEDHNTYYNITYVTDGATSSSAELCDKMIVGSTYDIPFVTKEGYFFRGWYKDSSFTERVYSIGTENESDVTLYAKFDEKTKADTYVSFVGDSISTYHGLIPPDAGAYYPTYVNFPQENTYFLLTCQGMGFNFLRNDSYSGSRLTGPVTSGDQKLPEAKSDKRIAWLTDGVHDPDILIIHIGTNDYSQGVNVSYYRNSIREYCQKVRKLYDDVEIYFCLHPANGYGVNYVEIREKFNNAIIEESKPEYSNYNIIDLRLAWNQDNYKEYIYSNAHPNEKGFKAMAEVIIAELKKTHTYE